MSQISAYIIAYNEQDKIADAINSVLWADEVVVIDSHSKDQTAEIAAKMGARVVQVDFMGFGDLRNQALKQCLYPWIFSLDADERCTPEARDAILAVVSQSESESDVYLVPRRNLFMGRWIKHSGWYPDYRQPQLFRRDCISYDNSPVHEKYFVHSKKPVGVLSADIWQIPFQNIAQMMHKANRYSTLGVDRLEKKYKKASMWRALGHGIWSFLKLYIFKAGFLDGWPGFVIAVGHFDGTFFRYAKHHEQQQNWQMPESPPLLRSSSNSQQDSTQ